MRSNSANHGISALQGGHQVAQKFSNTTLPLYADRRRSAPPASLRVKSGARPVRAWLACVALLAKRASHAPMQAARGAGKASKVKQPAATAAVTQVQLRLRGSPSESCSSKRANARVAFG